MAIYAIGDIHGCLAALETIFNQGQIQKEDTVVFLGDYIDRGPNSKGVFDWLLDNSKKYNFKFILGNHDLIMLAAKTDQDQFASWLQFGAVQTLASYGIVEDDPNWVTKIDPAHWSFIESCLPYLEMEQFIFVHAGLEAGKKLIEQDEHHLFWQKYETPELYATDKTVVCGHTARKNGQIADFGHTVCIDTFAYGGMWLTCLNVATGTYIKANNQGRVEKGELND